MKQASTSNLRAPLLICAALGSILGYHAVTAWESLRWSSTAQALEESRASTAISGILNMQEWTRTWADAINSFSSNSPPPFIAAGTEIGTFEFSREFARTLTSFLSNLMAGSTCQPAQTDSPCMSIIRGEDVSDNPDDLDDRLTQISVRTVQCDDEIMSCLPEEVANLATRFSKEIYNKACRDCTFDKDWPEDLAKNLGIGEFREGRYRVSTIFLIYSIPNLFGSNTANKTVTFLYPARPTREDSLDPRTRPWYLQFDSLKRNEIRAALRNVSDTQTLVSVGRLDEPLQGLRVAGLQLPCIMSLPYTDIGLSSATVRTLVCEVATFGRWNELTLQNTQQQGSVRVGIDFQWVPASPQGLEIATTANDRPSFPWYTVSRETIPRLIGGALGGGLAAVLFALIVSRPTPGYLIATKKMHAGQLVRSEEMKSRSEEEFEINLHAGKEGIFNLLSFGALRRRRRTFTKEVGIHVSPEAFPDGTEFWIASTIRCIELASSLFKRPSYLFKRRKTVHIWSAEPTKLGFPKIDPYQAIAGHADDDTENLALTENAIRLEIMRGSERQSFAPFSGSTNDEEVFHLNAIRDQPGFQKALENMRRIQAGQWRFIDGLTLLEGLASESHIRAVMSLRTIEHLFDTHRNPDRAAAVLDAWLNKGSTGRAPVERILVVHDEHQVAKFMGKYGNALRPVLTNLRTGLTVLLISKLSDEKRREINGGPWDFALVQRIRDNKTLEVVLVSDFLGVEYIGRPDDDDNVRTDRHPRILLHGFALGKAHDIKSFDARFRLLEGVAQREWRACLDKAALLRTINETNAA